MSAQSASTSRAASVMAASAASGSPASSSALTPWSPGSTPPLPGASSLEHAASKAKAIVTMNKLRTFASLALGALALAGCSSSSDKAPGASSDGPGASVVSDIISCKADSDCKSGEACSQGFCQMKRCASPSYASRSPLGTFGYAFIDRAFVVSQGDTTLQIFSPYTKSPTLDAGAAPLDITGGNLTGKRPESVAFVSNGLSTLTILGADGNVEKLIDLGFQATRVASGDTDGDGIDEVLAAGGTTYALCSAVTGSCKKGTLSTAATDVAMGDLDGDGWSELLFLGNQTVTSINLANNVIDSEPVTATLVNIAAADLDGDGKAELVGTEASGTFSSAKLHVFTWNGVVAEATVADLGTGSPDVVVAHQANSPVIAAISSPGLLATFTYSNRALSAGPSATIDSYTGKRLAASDVNGRSAGVRVKGDPTLVVGPPVPLAVLTFPPYSGQHSAGPSGVTLGSNTDTGTSVSHGTTNSTSTSLMVGAGITFDFEVVSASVNYYVTQTWSHSASHSEQSSTSLTVGGSYSMTADPSSDGYNSGGVVLAGGCFHQYDYTVEDPAGVLDATKQGTMSLFVPVGGETTLWSTARYNALVDALGGTLPKVTITPKLGDVSSYPSTPTTIDGQPIPDEDNVFPNPPVSRTSDVGTVGFSLSSSTSKSNTDAQTYSFDTNKAIAPNLNIGPVAIQGQYSTDKSTALDQSYGITISNSTTISGDVSPVRDDPNTPANEASLYGYSFTPYVYRHHYKTASGSDAAFYALTYTTGD